MALIDTEQDGCVRKVLTCCPACGFEFARGGGSQRANHIAGHDPEDFGLSPLGSATTDPPAPEVPRRGRA